MAKLTLTGAQRLLLGIVNSVESGVTSPEDAVVELKNLKDKAADAGVNLKADYTLEDFQKLRADYASQYESSTPYTYVEPSVPYEESSYYFTARIKDKYNPAKRRLIDALESVK